MKRRSSSSLALAIYYSTFVTKVYGKMLQKYENKKTAVLRQQFFRQIQSRFRTRTASMNTAAMMRVSFAKR
jgi:hypothetical protein